MRTEKHVTDQKTWDIIQDLLEINQDRLAGFQLVLEKLDPDTALSFLFQQTIRETKENISALGACLLENHPPEADTSVTGKVHRLWIDLKTAASGNDRGAILEEVIRGEEAFAELYTASLTTSAGLETQFVPMLTEQAAAQRHFLTQLKDFNEHPG